MENESAITVAEAVAQKAAESRPEAESPTAPYRDSPRADRNVRYRDASAGGSHSPGADGDESGVDLEAGNGGRQGAVAASHRLTD